MYAWLGDALGPDAEVVTASRRLARNLTDAYAQRQLAAGNSAWPSPSILAWQDWLSGLVDAADDPGALPTRINLQQSRVLWEQCLRREVNDPLVNFGMLVRQARDAWARISEWNVPLEACRDSAHGPDQRLFARVAFGYAALLERENWVDDAGLAGLVTRLAADGRLRLRQRITLAGFDRLVPAVKEVLGALRSAGIRIDRIEPPGGGRASAVFSYENADAELRAAGAWARSELERHPQGRIGLVVSNLEQDAARVARLVREGAVPGWQYAAHGHRDAVNVSFGQRFADYPAIATALLALRWLGSDLGTRDVSTLLLSSLAGRHGNAGRSRLELALRQLPDRHWSPARLQTALRGRDETADAVDWLERLAFLDSERRELPRRGAPSFWATRIDALLAGLNWPGDMPEDSADFQLVNRWRDLLNDFARLELVAPTLDFSGALARLTAMATETVFQAESRGAVIDVLGPLEAAGLEFDRLWVTGLSAANWPPAGRPLALLSRKLQRRRGMPDAEPADTLDYAIRVLDRLSGSAERIVFSYAQTDGDAEQTMSGLLAGRAEPAGEVPPDPGWHAGALCAGASRPRSVSDPVPAVGEDETLVGGAATIQRQFIEPFSAFVCGRLGVRPMQPVMNGLAANVRGSLIHDALRALYADVPHRAELAAWRHDVLGERIRVALRAAFRRQRRHADAVLNELLDLEHERVARLLENVVRLDSRRDFLRVASVESELETRISGVRLKLRYDRVDRLANGSIVILDYKTGARKSFLNRDREPRDMQLVVYACALGEPVAGLALVNVDSRHVDIDGAGECFGDSDWAATLAGWRQAVVDAADEIRRGDVRINDLLPLDSARPFSLLSRINELRHDLRD